MRRFDTYLDVTRRGRMALRLYSPWANICGAGSVGVAEEHVASALRLWIAGSYVAVVERRCAGCLS